jgi:hypothetical protein
VRQHGLEVHQPPKRGVGSIEDCITVTNSSTKGSIGWYHQ